MAFNVIYNECRDLRASVILAALAINLDEGM
jgi:hypothetical protein